MITGQNANAKMSWPKIPLQKMVAKTPNSFRILVSTKTFRRRQFLIIHDLMQCII